MMNMQCWGYNGSGGLGDEQFTGRFSTTPVRVDGLAKPLGPAAGGDHTRVALANLTSRCWGANDAGQLGNGTTVDASTPITVSV